MNQDTKTELPRNTLPIYLGYSAIGAAEVAPIMNPRAIEEEFEDDLESYNKTSKEQGRPNPDHHFADWTASPYGCIRSIQVKSWFLSTLRLAITASQALPQHMRGDWMGIVSEGPCEQWVHDISHITLPNFKSLLDRSAPPTFEELEQLDSYTTDHMGVYLSPIKPKHAMGVRYLYIGSASSDRGLAHRIQQHCNTDYSKREAAKGSFHHRILNQKYTPYYGTYLLACVANSFPLAGTTEYFELRKTVVFAEAIYTHWLFGIWKKGLMTEYSILRICPWNRNQLSWTGCCRFSPFTFPLPGRLNNLSLKERQTNARKRQILRYAGMSRQEKYRFRENIYRREGRDFRRVSIVRYKKRIREQDRDSGRVVKRSSRRCAFCRSEEHLIADCNAPGKEEFMKHKWKGRYYHINKSKPGDDEKSFPVTRAPRVKASPRCSICKEEGHNIRTCSRPEAAAIRSAPRCSTCWGTGHNCLKCPMRKSPEIGGQK